MLDYTEFYKSYNRSLKGFLIVCLYAYIQRIYIHENVYNHAYSLKLFFFVVVLLWISSPFFKLLTFDKCVIVNCDKGRDIYIYYNCKIINI